MKIHSLIHILPIPYSCRVGLVRFHLKCLFPDDTDRSAALRYTSQQTTVDNEEITRQVGELILCGMDSNGLTAYRDVLQRQLLLAKSDVETWDNTPFKQSCENQVDFFQAHIDRLTARIELQETFQ